MKKRGILSVLLIVVMTMLCGCGGMSAEDAQSYLKSVLDASYKGEFGTYIEWTKSTQEEAKKLYDANIDVAMQESGLESLGLSEELTANYRQLFEDTINLVKYEVGEAEETGDKEYTIHVTLEPFVGYVGIQEEAEAVIQEEMQNLTEIPDQATINEMYYQKRYDMMAERAASPEYGDAVTVEVTVKPDSQGVYFIDQSDMTALDEALFVMD